MENGRKKNAARCNKRMQLRPEGDNVQGVDSFMIWGKVTTGNWL